ncbi:MAG: DUF167 domain-containing protein [Spirochaetia bacterium]|nr:DUF167 domain-containing protein [Spirochaetia bacterium]
MINIGITNDGAFFKVRTIPGASKSGVCGEHNGALKVKVNARPENGRANRELIECLAAFLGVKKADVTLARGEKSRNKTVVVKGISVEKISDILGGQNGIGTEKKS